VKGKRGGEKRKSGDPRSVPYRQRGVFVNSMTGS
jgi:hypothetical protein